MAIGEVRQINTNYRPEPEPAAGTFAIEGISKVMGGAAAVVFSILALADVWPRPLTAIAAIAVGSAALIEGWALASRWNDLLGGTTGRALGSGSGLTSETLAGTVTIVCGVFALLKVAALPLILMSSIVLGGALLLGCISRVRLQGLTNHYQDDTSHRAARDAVWTAMGARLLIAVAGIALGVLGLRGSDGPTMAEMAMLCFGLSALLGAAGSSTRIPGFTRY